LLVGYARDVTYPKEGEVMNDLSPERLAQFEAYAAEIEADDYEPREPSPGADDDPITAEEFLAPWMPELVAIARDRLSPVLGPSAAVPGERAG
jgi:hypothetical protein